MHDIAETCSFGFKQQLYTHLCPMLPESLGCLFMIASLGCLFLIASLGCLFLIAFLSCLFFIASLGCLFLIASLCCLFLIASLVFTNVQNTILCTKTDQLIFLYQLLFAMTWHCIHDIHICCQCEENQNCYKWLVSNTNFLTLCN